MQCDSQILTQRGETDASSQGERSPVHMPLGTRRRRGRKSKAASEVVAHPSLAALKKNKKNKKKRKGQSSWLTLEFATPHGIGRGRRMWIAWASWQLQASLPIELHIPHSQPLAPITHHPSPASCQTSLPSSAMMSNQICSSLGIPSQTDRQNLWRFPW